MSAAQDAGGTNLHRFRLALLARRARAALGMSQQAFAEDMDVPVSVVVALEGERPVRTPPARLARLARLLAVRVEDLVGDPDVAAEAYPAVDRPATRGDCLTAERRRRLQVLRAEEVVDPEDAPDGANCARPCPFVSCRFHTYLDLHEETGEEQLNFPDLLPEELASEPLALLAALPPEARAEVQAEAPGRLVASCVLDVADFAALEGRELTLHEIGALLGLTHERARQVAHEADAHAREAVARSELRHRLRRARGG